MYKYEICGILKSFVSFINLCFSEINKSNIQLAKCFICFAKVFLNASCNSRLALVCWERAVIQDKPARCITR